MAIKIHEFHPDENGHMTAHGIFDGEPFRLLADGAGWLMRVATGQAQAVPANDVSSRTEARSAIYAAVARLRESQKSFGPV